MATPLAPPVGDEMVVSMTFAVPRREVRSGARVVGVQRASGPEHRAGGFVTSLAIDAPLCRELARTAARVREPKAHSDFRRARFVHARASRRASEEAASLRGASTEGAVLATRRPAPCGACVLVTVHLPVVGERTVRAVVERATRRGMIVRFAVDASEEAALGAGLAAFALQPRRVLRIDRNRVRREETAQTLRGEGFHVLTARVSPSGTLRRRPGEPFDVVVATCARRDDALPLLGALRGISRDEAAPAVVLRASLASSFDARLLRAEADEVVGLSTSAPDLARLTREVLDAAPPLGERRVPPQACAVVATSVAV